eukprot:14881432-Ditylum_brightwellii.AAC.1
MVKSLCLDNLDKYVFQPSMSQITEDLLLGLNRFKILVRWKESWCLKVLNDKTTILTKEDDTYAKQGEDFESVQKKEGLGKGLTPTNSNKAAKQGSREVEDFFHRFESITLGRLQKYKVNGISKKDKVFRGVFKQLNKAKKMANIQTNKIDSFTVVSLVKCKTWVEAHLEKNAEAIPWQEVVQIHHAGELLAEDLKDKLSTRELCFLNEGIAYKAIPQPQLLVKDHEERDEHGDFPTKLVIPVTNVMAIISKMVYMTIQKVLDDAGVIYNKHTIVQSLDLKRNLKIYNLLRVKQR